MRRCLSALLCILSLCAANSLHARSSDANQPVHIEADSVEIREQEGVSIYRGHVKISRGSMLIKGELIHIFSQEQNIDRIEVEGQPASFYQLNDAGEEISAQSLDMTYTAADGILEMKQEAILVQHQNRFTSQHIIYDTRQDIVRAGEQPTTTEQPAEQQTPSRVTITIKPKQDDQNKQPPADTP